MGKDDKQGIMGKDDKQGVISKDYNVKQGDKKVKQQIAKEEKENKKFFRRVEKLESGLNGNGPDIKKVVKNVAKVTMPVHTAAKTLVDLRSPKKREEAKQSAQDAVDAARAIGAGIKNKIQGNTYKRNDDEGQKTVTGVSTTSQAVKAVKAVKSTFRGKSKDTGQSR